MEVITAVMSIFKRCGAASAQCYENKTERCKVCACI